MSYQQVLLLFCVCGKGKWELAANLSVFMRDNCTSLVPALQHSRTSCFTAGEGEIGSHNTGSLGYWCWPLCLWQQGGLDVFVCTVSFWYHVHSLWWRIRRSEWICRLLFFVIQVSRQDNSPLDLCKCWLHGVNKVVTYPCPSSFTCTFWSIMHIAFWLLFPCEGQSQ